jgi:hypothetical protein
MLSENEGFGFQVSGSKGVKFSYETSSDQSFIFDQTGRSGSQRLADTSYETS